MAKETRKQKIDRQRGHAADRAFGPIRDAIDRGDLVVGPARTPETPKCAVCGFLMCEEFEYKAVSEDMEIAIPTGCFSCLACRKNERAAAPPVVDTQKG